MHINEWKPFRNALLGDNAVMELVSGTNMTFCRYTINKKLSLPEHSHDHEQITFIVCGEMLLTVENITYRLKAGDVRIIPANARHSGEITVIPFQTTESFCPARADFIDKITLQNSKSPKSERNADQLGMSG
jgi:glyoxylate utilization-related uncharacterized protein